MQETATRALRQGDEYFANNAHLVGWCVVTAINYSTDVRRRDAREHVSEFVDLIDWTDIADRVTAGIALDRAVAEVARLTDSERDVLFGRVQASTRREAVKFNVQRNRLRVRLREATGGLAAAIARVRLRVPRLLKQSVSPGLAAAVAVGVGLAMVAIPHLGAQTFGTHSSSTPDAPASGHARELKLARDDVARVSEGSSHGGLAAPRQPYLRIPLGTDQNGEHRQATLAPARPDQRGQLVCGEFVGSERTCVRSPFESATETASAAAGWILGGGDSPDITLWPVIYTEPRPPK